MQKSEQEKRKFKRFRLPVAHYEGKDDKGVCGVSDVLDVCRDGFRILSVDTIKKGTALEFKINVPGVLDIRCKGKVCWSESAEGRHWEGLRFTEIDPADKAELLEYAYKMWVQEEKTNRVR